MGVCAVTSGCEEVETVEALVSLFETSFEIVDNNEDDILAYNKPWKTDGYCFTRIIFRTLIKNIFSKYLSLIF